MRCMFFRFQLQWLSARKACTVRSMRFAEAVCTLRIKNHVRADRHRQLRAAFHVHVLHAIRECIPPSSQRFAEDSALERGKKFP
jgi:hypothetical protein